MKKSSLALLCAGAMIGGLLLFALQRGWIIFIHPATPTMSHANTTIEHKQVTLYFWHQKRWNKEEHTILWTDSTVHNCQLLIKSWLTVLEDEQVTNQLTALQSVIIDPSGSYAYLSFDRNPLPSDASTYQKWMWVESLLKTIHTNGINLSGIYLLVHHQKLLDDHLDFTNPWPLHGFTTK